MKKKKLFIIIAGLAMIALIGGTYAAFTASTSAVEKVSTDKLGIEIVQGKDQGQKGLTDISGYGDAKDAAGVSYKGTPGDEVAESVAVKNTENIDCFVRVTTNRSWMKESADGGAEKVFDDVDPKEIRIAVNDDWFVAEDPDDSEVIYCYYKKALTAGATQEVMQSFSVLKNDIMGANSNQYAGLSANIIFEADAVQKAAAEAAMKAEWGVEADIQGDQLAGMPTFQ